MKKFLSTLVFVLAAGVIFASGSDDLMKALKDKNVEAVQTVLDECSDEEAPLFEEMILEDSKRAVKKDDLDYAYKLAEVVLMYDFDNTEAQNLFTSIEKAKKSKAEVAAKEAEKERKRQEEAEKLRKLEEYNALKQEEENKKKKHEEAVSKITIKNFPLEVGLSPVSFDYTKSEIRDDYEGKKTSDFKYGAGLYTDLGFVHPYVLTNLHINYNFLLLSFGGNGMKSDLKTRLTFGTPILSDYVRFSLGYDSLNYINSNKSVVLTDIYAGTIGFGVENLRIKDVFDVTVFADLNTVSFFSSNVNMSYDIDFSFRYDLPIKVLNKKLYAENNTVFTAFQISQKWEYSVGTRFVVGVYINE